MTEPSATATPDGTLRALSRLLRPFLPVALLSALAGVAAGLASAWLLATINDALHAPDGATGGLLLRFAALVLLSVAGTALGGIGNSVAGQRMIAALRKDISARILAAPVAAVERARVHTLNATLNNDVDTVSAFTFNASGYAVALAITLGGFGYLLYLSPLVFTVAIAALALGVAINIVAKLGWIRDYEAVRDAQDELQKQYRALTEGAKELRLARERRARVYDRKLSGAADGIASHKSRAMTLFWTADAAGSAIFFVVIGGLLALQHRLGIDSATISGAVLVLLYVKGPIEQIAAGLPALGQAQVALRRIGALSLAFAEGERRAAGTPLVLRESLALRGGRYTYPDSGFTLGPVDLEIRRGETVFIVGENGSGKTTLIKLLLGLYRPDVGEVLLDGVPVPPERADDYRQLFSAVFSDYFLFDDLLTDDPDVAQRADFFLERLEIAHKVQARDGRFTTTDLSSGQRKRVALVHAWLEGRSVLMCDEWAADQDPTFRGVFYRELLPEMQRAGKTLIIVSHDDRFFDAADRVIHVRDGQIA